MFACPLCFATQHSRLRYVSHFLATSSIATRPVLFYVHHFLFHISTDPHHAQGVTPQALCDEFHRLHKEIYDWFNINFDYFGRTSTPAGSEITQDIFLKLLKSGYILEKTTEQQYCEKCQRFLADRYVEGTCPHCKADNANGDQVRRCQVSV